MIVSGLLVGLFAGSFAVVPVSALTQEESNIVFSLAQRKSYRLGLRGGIISQTDTVNVDKNSTFDLGLEFDAKPNENFDTGPRFGIISKKLQNTGGYVVAAGTRLAFF